MNCMHSFLQQVDEEYTAHIARVQADAREVAAVGYSEGGRKPCLYWAINKVDWKIYIGVAVDFKSRVQAHKSAARSGKSGGRLYPAMREVGLKNFEFVMIKRFETEAEANEAEKIEILECRSQDPMIGYNTLSGGSGVGSAAGKKAAETRRRNRYLKNQSVPALVQAAGETAGGRPGDQTRPCAGTANDASAGHIVDYCS